MPCSSDHFVRVSFEPSPGYKPPPGEEPAPPAKGAGPISENQRQSAANEHPGWGGRRPGAGAPKGNLNAFKHGRTSRRQAEILEAMVQIPGVQQALIDLARRNRLRSKRAEEGLGVLLTRLLERTAALVLSGNNQGDDQDQNKQDFLDYLNATGAQMREILGKRSRLRRTTIKRTNHGPGGRS